MTIFTLKNQFTFGNGENKNTTRFHTPTGRISISTHQVTIRSKSTNRLSPAGGSNKSFRSRFPDFPFIGSGHLTQD